MEAIKLLFFAFQKLEQLFPWLNNLAKASKSKSKQTPILVMPYRDDKDGSLLTSVTCCAIC